MGKDQDLMVIGGLHDVRLALENRPDTVIELWMDVRREDKRMSEVAALAKSKGVRLTRVNKHELEAMSRGLRHQGVLAQCRAPEAGGESGLETFLANLDHDPLLLILDGVQDPHNLGACMRTADGAGVDALIVPENRSCKITPVVSRVAAGATHALPFYAVTNLSRTLDMLKRRGVWIVGADDSGQTLLWECDLKGPVALVMGAEGAGLRDLTKKHCDFLAGLPMSGVVESLNVSVAAGVMMYEAVRQRHQSQGSA